MDATKPFSAMSCLDCPAFGYSHCPVEPRDIEDLCCKRNRSRAISFAKVPTTATRYRPHIIAPLRTQSAQNTGILTPPDETIAADYFPSSPASASAAPAAAVALQCTMGLSASLDSLPFEIREQIAWECSQRDAVRLCSTSSNLMHSTLPRLYSHIIFDNTPIHYCEELPTEGNGLLSKVTTIGGMRECLRSLTNPDKARMVKKLELRRVDVPDFDIISAAREFLPFMTRLEKLVWTFTSGYNKTLELLGNKQALKHLQVSRVHDLSPDFCNLRVLETSEIKTLPPTTHLESLTLRMCQGLASLDGLSMRKLKKLHISRIPGRADGYVAVEAIMLARAVDTSQLTHMTLELHDSGFLQQLASSSFDRLQFLKLDVTEDTDTISGAFRVQEETESNPGCISGVATFLAHVNTLSLDLTLHWNSSVVHHRQYWPMYCGEMAGALGNSKLRHLHLECKEDDRGTLMIPYFCLSYIVGNLAPYLQGLGLSYPLLDNDYTYNRSFSNYGNGETLLDLLGPLNVKYLDLLNCGPPPRACSLVGGGAVAVPGFEDGHHPDDYSRVIREILPSIPTTEYVGIGSHVFDVRSTSRLPVVRDGLRGWFIDQLLGHPQSA